MKLRQSLVAACVCTILLGGVTARAKDKKPVQTGWAEVTSTAVEVYRKASVGKKSLAHLSPRSLVPTFESKQSKSVQWTKISTADPATLQPVTGWVESSRLKTFPTDQFPSDEDLQKVLGGAFLEDIHTQDMRMLRYLLRPGDQEPTLLVFIGATFLPQTRLQAFVKKDGNWTAGPSFEYMPVQLKTGLAEIEIRDLIGDGRDCLITREPFAQSFGASGVNLVIRRIEGDVFKTVWQAPLEIRNLSSYPPKIKVLSPPEKNIGIPGSISTGEVEYRRSGKVEEPVWKGKVDFHIPGREKPLNTVNVEKVCPWNGSEFAPLN